MENEKNVSADAPQVQTEQITDAGTSQADVELNNNDVIDTQQGDAVVEATEGVESESEQVETTSSADEDKTQDVVGETKTDDVQIDGLEQLEDGSFLLRVDPNNPEGTVYKGKSIQELFTNVRSGVAAKDNYIHELKQQYVTSDNKPLVEDNIPFLLEEDGSSSVPDEEAIKENVIARFAGNDKGFLPEMLYWSGRDWDSYETDNGLRVTRDYENLAKSINANIKREVDGRLLSVINKGIMKDEAESVREVIKTFGLEKQFTTKMFESVLKRVSGDKNSYRDGALKSGLVLAECVKEMSKLQKQKQVAVTSGVLKNVVAKATSSVKQTTKTLPNSKTTFKSPTRPAMSSLDEAFKNALRDKSLTL